jgi:hypothetical protein
MISFIVVIIGVWVLTGFIALVLGTKALTNPMNREEIHEQFKEIAEELRITEEDCLCILYVGFMAIGFAGVSLALFRRLKRYLRRTK